jgi:putative membrane protein
MLGLGHGVLAAALALATSAACARSDKTADSAAPANAAATATATSTSTSGDSMAGHNTGGMQGMANMTGNADHDFLRMMADHHEGLVVMTQMTKKHKDVGTAAADAAKLDAAQAKQVTQMVGLLEKDYKDRYAPKVMPEHQAMIDDLKTKSGKDYERTFYQDLIKHHQEAITMIDAYLPKAKNPMVKQMAEKMKAIQTRQIADFQQRLSKLGT